MEPYYVDEASKIMLFCGDVGRVTMLLKAQEDWPGQVMTVTDPPYNVGMDYGPEVDDKRDADEYMNWCNDWYKLVPKPLVLTPGFVNFEMWTAWIEWPTAIVPWIKPNQGNKPLTVRVRGDGERHGAWHWFNAWEPVLFYGQPPSHPKQDVIMTPIAQQADVRRRNSMGQIIKRHPCPKFLPFWIKLIGNIWKPGWTIYDPFVGSGTTALACKRLGIPLIGVDCKREYLDLTIERLAQEVIPLPEAEIDDTVNYRLAQQAMAFETNGVAHAVEVEA